MPSRINDSEATHSGFWLGVVAFLIALPSVITWNVVEGRKLWQCDQTKLPTELASVNLC